MIAHCLDCGDAFWRADSEDWKRRCLPCWQASRGAQRRTDFAPSRLEYEQLRDELAENLPALLQLVHPDKHEGSAAATRVTQWLLDVRRRLRERLAA